MKNFPNNVFVILLFFSASCEKEVEKYMIPETKMVNILADIHISEAAVSHLSLTLRDSISREYLVQILQIHQIKADEFDKEYRFLKNDSEKLQQLYPKVIDRINELKLTGQGTE